MDVLLVFARLLDYPEATLSQEQSLYRTLIAESPLSVDSKQALLAFLEQSIKKDLLDLQAEYEGLFERGRSLGLWLFEHVHGESRDRGQAMVDLLAHYREAGLEIDRHELPDYLPLFLEFLITQGDDNARDWLRQVEHILAILQCRLEQRESEYAVLFTVLLELADGEVDIDAIREQLADEKRDDTPAALDKEWQEEAVTFGSDNPARANTTQQQQPEAVPVTWTDFK